MSIKQLNEEKETIFVIPTGFIDKFKKVHPKIHLVNYSSHSSFSELQQFVKAVRPEKLLFSSTKKDYKYQNYLIKTYCRDKGQYSHKKEYRNQIGIQTKLNFTMLKSSKQRKCSSDMGLADNKQFLPSLPSQDQVKKQAASLSSSSDQENKKQPKSLLSIRKINQLNNSKASINQIQRNLSKAQPKKKKVTIQRGAQFKHQRKIPAMQKFTNKRKMREISNLRQNIIKHEEKKYSSSQRSASQRSSTNLQNSFSKHRQFQPSISSSQISTRSQQRAAAIAETIDKEMREGIKQEKKRRQPKIKKQTQKKNLKRNQKLQWKQKNNEVKKDLNYYFCNRSIKNHRK